MFCWSVNCWQLMCWLINWLVLSNIKRVVMGLYLEGKCCQHEMLSVVKTGQVIKLVHIWSWAFHLLLWLKQGFSVSLLVSSSWAVNPVNFGTFRTLRIMKLSSSVSVDLPSIWLQRLGIHHKFSDLLRVIGTEILKMCNWFLSLSFL